MSKLAEQIRKQMDIHGVSVTDLSYDLDIPYQAASKIAKGQVSKRYIQPLSDYLKSPSILRLWIKENKGERTGFQLKLFTAIMHADTETKQALKAKLGEESYINYTNHGTRPNIKNMRIIVETLGDPHLVESLVQEVKRETKDKDAVSRFLRVNRFRQLLTREDMANALGIKVYNYNAIEDRTRNIHVADVPTLAKLFGVEALDQDWSTLIPEAATPFAGVALREAIINNGEGLEEVAQATKVDPYTLTYAMCFDVIALTRDEIDRIAEYLHNKKLVKPWKKRNAMMKTFGELVYVARIRQKMTRKALANLLAESDKLGKNGVALVESNRFNVSEPLKHRIAKVLKTPSLEDVDVVIEKGYKSFVDKLQECIEQDGRRMSSLSRAARVPFQNFRVWAKGKNLPRDEHTVDRLVELFDCPELKIAWRKTANR